MYRLVGRLPGAGPIRWSSSETSGKMKEERQSWLLLISISAKNSAPS